MPPARRRRSTLLTTVLTLTAMAALAGCGAEDVRSVDGVSVPPPLSTTERTAPPAGSTAGSTTEAPSDGATSTSAGADGETTTSSTATTSTAATTTTYPPPESGPPSSVEAEYVTGGGRRPRTPCEPGPDLGQLVLGANCRHLTIDGMTREYVVYVPASADRSEPAPLVVFLHGDGSDGDDAITATGWKNRADDNGYVLAFPTSLEYERRSPAQGWTFQWNGFELIEEISLTSRVEGYPAAAPIPADDVDFVTAMVADIGYQWPIDTTRVLGVGVESGADLVARMTIESPGTFTAAALVAGGPGSPGLELPPVTRSVPTMMIVGTDDVALAEVSTTEGQDPAVPLAPDEFLASDVGAFLVERLAELTGTDPATPRVDADQHVTVIDLIGPGVGDTSGFARIVVVNGLDASWPLPRNNVAELIGTNVVGSFFDFVTAG